MAEVLAGFGSATDAPPSAGVDSANSNLAGTGFAVLLPILNSGTVDAIYVKSANAVTNRRGAIYAYDGTNTLTGRARLSGDVTPPTAGAGAYAGWHKYTISPGVAILLSGVNIWLEFVAIGTTYDYTDFATTGGTTRDTTGLATLADPHPTTSANFTNRFNAFAEGTVDVGAPPVPAFVARMPALGSSAFAPGLRGPGTDFWGDMR